LKKRVIVTLVLALAIIVLMLWHINPGDLWDKLKETNLNLILLVLILYIINIITKAFRWYLLINSSGTNVPFKKVFPFYIIALAINNVTPGKIGGEPIRAYLLKKEAEVSMGQGIASIFAEKILDIIVITTMAVIGAVFILPLLPPQNQRILIIALVFVVAAILISIYIVSYSNLLEKTVDKSMGLAKKVSSKDSVLKMNDLFTGFVDKFKFGLKEISKNQKSAIACVSMTVIIWINESVRLFIILLALPDVADISLGAVFIAASIANLLGIAIPLGAGNVLGISTVLMTLGYGSDTSGAASFLHPATSIWISVPLGVIAMLVTGFKFSKLKNNKNNNNDDEIKNEDNNQSSKSSKKNIGG
jgi:uncharacterized protein (TIRG00374 family)